MVALRKDVAAVGAGSISIIYIYILHLVQCLEEKKEEDERRRR